MLFDINNESINFGVAIIQQKIERCFTNETFIKTKVLIKQTETSASSIILKTRKKLEISYKYINKIKKGKIPSGDGSR